MKKLIGILTIVTALSMLTLTAFLLMDGIMFKAIHLKLAMANLYVLVVLSGFYLLDSYSYAKSNTSKYIKLFGLVPMIVGVLVSFNILDFKAMWNIPVTIGIIYITLIELQLLKWEKSKNVLKIMGLLTIVSNAFLVIFFLLKLSIHSMGMVLDIAIITSVFSFLIGLILSKPLRKSKQASTESEA